MRSRLARRSSRTTPTSTTARSRVENWTHDLPRLRADALSGHVPRAARREPGGEGAGGGDLEPRSTTSATSRPTSIAASTIRPPAAARGWCFGRTCLRPRSTASRQTCRPMLALTPRGAPLTQARVRELAGGEGVILLCGRFEGFDERIFDARPLEPVSIGDYVLSGGELGAMVDPRCLRAAASRGNGRGLQRRGGELQRGASRISALYPASTWEGRTIPEVLRSGDHAKIAAWRHERAVEDTRLRRPDLIERHGGASQAPPSGARRRDTKA